MFFFLAGCYPYYNVDPFLIEGELPHVYFAGNQLELQSKLIEHPRESTENDEDDEGPIRKILLLSLPKFSDSGICALVNLRTLEVEPIAFAADELFNGHHHHGNGYSDLSMEVDPDETPLNSARGTPNITGTPDLFA